MSTITSAPIILHFSGHGQDNTRESLGWEYEIYKSKGKFLILEDLNCEAANFYQDDLKELISTTSSKTEVVFVSSCHS